MFHAFIENQTNSARKSKNDDVKNNGTLGVTAGSVKHNTPPVRGREELCAVLDELQVALPVHG